MPEPTILIVSGTNRPDANALKLARILQGHYRDANINADLFSLTDLPPEVFNGSAYASKPPAMLAIQKRVLDAAGLHVITPEYNGSFPGVLKYFIDMLKFPESFDRKPVAFVGVASGEWGGLRAVEQMQMVFGYRNAHVYPDRIFVSSVKDKLDAAGNLNDQALNDRLARQVVGFAQFAGLFVRKPSA